MSQLDVPTDPTVFLDMLKRLSPSAQGELMEAIKVKQAARPFYCKSPGRDCDGDPHEGYDYQHARGDQWPPVGIPGTDWKTWLAMSGRGGGKTRSGAEYTRALSKRMELMGIIAPTTNDIRATIVEGPSGLLKVCEMAGEKGLYEPSKQRFTFEKTGARVLLVTAEEPERMRGKQVEFWWGDEPAHWPKVEDVWEQINFTLRLGSNPHILLTTTPLPTKWMKARIADPRTRLVRVSTFANKANLSEDFIETMKAQYEGTRMGRQELYGEVLDDVEGALWNMDMFSWIPEIDTSQLRRIVVGVDPAGSANRKSDETGIIAVGSLGGSWVVLDDATGKYTPDQWARETERIVDKWGADAVVVERNYGGDMVRHTLKSVESKTRVIEVRATRGKRVRAEPVVAKYEQGRVSHLPGLEKMEEELVTWVPDSGQPSPNRLDALVWAMSELAGGGEVKFFSPRGMA